MKNVITKNRKMLIAAIIVLTAVSELFAQGNSQNNPNGLWYAIDGDTVTTNREVLIKKNLNVKGNASADTVKASIIKVGNSSIWIGMYDQNTNTNNNISADDGDLLLQSMTGVNFNTLINANNAGKVGIGLFNQQPTYRLDVMDDINIWTSGVNQGYRIGGVVVLQNPMTNIFVGKWAGFFNNGSFNSFLGYQAGYNNLMGHSNSFIGNQAGYNNASGGENSFLGSESGYKNISGSYNSFLGFQVGYNNTTGFRNSFFGYKSGYLNNGGTNNSFLGVIAGYNNTDGYNNTFLGSVSGFSNTTGSNNTYLGYMADGTAGLTNATALGSEAKVMNSDNMILGNNRVRAGLGLSGESTGPQNNLEIFL